MLGINRMFNTFNGRISLTTDIWSASPHDEHKEKSIIGLYKKELSSLK